MEQFLIKKVIFWQFFLANINALKDVYELILDKSSRVVFLFFSNQYFELCFIKLVIF